MADQGDGNVDEVPPVVLPPHPQNLSFPAALAEVVGASVHRLLTAPEWLTVFQNADRFGPPVNSNRIPTETEGLYRIDNYHNVDKNEWTPKLRSIQGTTKSWDLVFNTRKAVGYYHYDIDGDLVQDWEYQGPTFTLKRLTVRNHQSELNLDDALTFAHYYFEERYEG